MRAGFMWTTSERTVTDLSRELGKNFAGQTALHGGFSMNPSLLALAAVEIISHLKDELAKAHNRVLVLEEQVVQKERWIQELSDSLLMRVVKSHMQTGTKRLKGSESGSAEAVSAVLFEGV